VNPEATAAQVLGFTELRPGQAAAITALTEGRDVLVVMPSAAGKSAIYQVAAIARGGPAVVVSPLLSLQRDQASALRARGLPAIPVNAGTRARAREDAFRLLRDGSPGFVFLAPEQLARQDVQGALAASPPALVAVDEAHCVAAWGHDFRPDYLRIGAATDGLSPRPPVAALTATAAPPVREEIIARLRLRSPRRVITGFDRPEIHLAVRSYHDRAAKDEGVLEVVRAQRGSGLVYAATRRQASALAAALDVPAYHAGLGKQDREAAQRAFMAGRTIVATSAFGMGIDRPDVRFVIHAAVPGSLDEYYQETGRAARDGGPAAAVCCYLPDDLALPRFFAGGLPGEELLAGVASAVREPVSRRELARLAGITERRLAGLLNLLEAAGAVRLRRRVEPAPGAPAPAEAAAIAREGARRQRSVERSRIEMMRRYAELTDCRRRFLLGYFGEQVSDPCGRCDNCDAGRSTAASPSRGEGALAAGTRVNHTEWGPGVVIAAEQDRLTVLFDTVGYKELAASVALGGHLITPAGGLPAPAAVSGAPSAWPSTVAPREAVPIHHDEGKHHGNRRIGRRRHVGAQATAGRRGVRRRPRARAVRAA
jgi:ATP-dependent DNA helicase RecQ